MAKSLVLSAVVAGLFLSTAAIAADKNAVTSDGFRWVGGEAGWAYDPQAQRSATSREAVQAETIRRQGNPTADAGWIFVGGETGWAYSPNARSNAGMSADRSSIARGR